MIRVSKLLAERGWAEANAGNMSVKVDVDDLPQYTQTCCEHRFDNPFPDLAGDWFVVTATKSRARDMERIPSRTIGLMEIMEGGIGSVCHWGTAPPTSEFPAHLSIYSACKEAQPEIKAVLHTHPPNLVALSHLPDMQDPGRINKALRSMHPEVPILVPGGINVMEFCIPGSFELGCATGDALKTHRIAMWPMHGVVSIAEDLEKALDQIEIIEKAATIYMLVRSTGQDPVGLSREQIIESRAYWGIRDRID